MCTYFIFFFFLISRKILNVSSGMDDFGGLQLDLVFCLFICWAIVFACLFNGLKSMGKVGFGSAKK